MTFTKDEIAKLKQVQKDSKMMATDLQLLIQAPNHDRLYMIGKQVRRMWHTLGEVEDQFDFEGKRKGVEAELVDDREPIITPPPRRKQLPGPSDSDSTQAPIGSQQQP
jgi:hypothetical protein